MKLVPTRRTDYAIRALVYLAAAPERRRKAAEIASGMDIPKGFLHQVLQELQRAELVESMPGPTGGYALARSPEAISLLEVVETLEGPLDDGGCALRGGPCHWDAVCALHWVWASAREAFAEQMARATIARVARDDAELAAGRRAVPANAHRGKRARAP